MGLYTIPEEITGIPLFVPPGNDYFLIEEGGLPNGDDCLIVQGAVSTGYKAFQAAQSIGGGIFTTRASSNFSISFWFKCSATATPPAGPSGHPQVNNVLFGVQGIAGVNSYSDTGSTWLVCANNQGGLARISFWANTSGGAAFTNVCRDGNWHLIVINVSGTVDCYVDTDASPPGALSSSRLGTASMVEPYFSIGAYGNHANSVGYNEQWRIGKLMFHDHLLTHAERISLVMAMGVAASLPYSGSYYSLVVPSMVTSMEVELYGAAGANTEGGGSGLGGQGGYLKSQHTVTPGETIRIYIGQQGQYNETTAFNGGGYSDGSTTTAGGGGGGATDIRRTPFALADRLAVAGAGGGAGAGFVNGQPDKNGGHGAGNGAGVAGANSNGGGLGGGGGQVASGGTAGSSGGAWGGVPTAGTLGTGGNSGEYHGGGGGAGIYGGGGGFGHTAPAGGGGGSGGVLDGGTVVTSSSGTRAGHGLATARWIFP